MVAADDVSRECIPKNLIETRGKYSRTLVLVRLLAKRVPKSMRGSQVPLTLVPSTNEVRKNLGGFKIERKRNRVTGKCSKLIRRRQRDENSQSVPKTDCIV